MAETGNDERTQDGHTPPHLAFPLQFSQIMNVDPIWLPHVSSTPPGHMFLPH